MKKRKGNRVLDDVFVHAKEGKYRQRNSVRHADRRHECAYALNAGIAYNDGAGNK